MYNIIYIDEKGFYMIIKKLENYYQLLDEEDLFYIIKSKKLIGKVMFLVFIGRLRFDE